MLWYGSDRVGPLLAYGDDKVAIGWFGDDEVYRAGAAPTPTAETVTFNYVTGTDATFTLRGVEYTVRVQRTSGRPNNLMGLVFPSVAARAAAVAAWDEITAEVNGTARAVQANGHWFTAGDSVILSGWSGGDAIPGGGSISLTSTPFPAPAALPVSFTLKSVTIAAGRAWGVFGGLRWRFVHSGRTYTINGWFTDQNGLHIRFASQADALAFIAANLAVDSGIAGAPALRSGTWVNLPAIDARTGPSFAQRYADATEYTVTISA